MRDPWRKIRWETELECGCILPGTDPPNMSAKGFYQYFRPHGPRTENCPLHGEQLVVKRRETGVAERRG